MSAHSIRWSLATLVVAVLLSRGMLLGADPKPAQPIDKELLKDLQSKPLDDFDRQLFAPEDKKPKTPGPPPEKGGPAGKGRGEDDGKLSRELGAAAIQEGENPLLEIARQMRDVEGLIGQAQSGAKTQQMQADIVAELAKLIKQCRSGAGQCKPSQGKPPGTAPRQQVSQPQSKPGSTPGKVQTPKAAKDSNVKDGKPQDRRAEVGEVMALLKQQLWGELPERMREQMLQFAPDEFLPKYELLIEDYFKRLAEEKK